MNALESVIKWAESDLTEWQSDAVRRLLVQDDLTDDDRNEILLMLKALQGLLPNGVTPPKAQPLHKGMVSGASISKTKVVLKAVKGLRSVNKIPDGSVLPFGHQGLTVIYGENGSGKSGYARVLKRACRARDTQESILPNVYDTGLALPAKATFKISVDDGTDQEVVWEDGVTNHEVLTNITVFDSKCARVIVDEKNEATYLPYGAHVFEELVDLLHWIRQQIEAEKPKVDPSQLPEITPGTKTGNFLAALTHETKEKEVEDAASWTDEDSQKLGALTKLLEELEANDPVKQAAKSRSFKERIENLRSYVERRISSLSNVRLRELKEKRHALAEAEKAVALASQALQNEPLLGAGKSAWQMLYAAAKDYSTQDAYPNDEFPVVDDDSLCVLCMQELNEDAKQRLLRFKTFMEQAAKKEQESTKQTLDAEVKAIQALKDSAAVDQHANTISEIKQRNETAAAATESCLAVANSRLGYFELIASGKEAGDLPPPPTSPVNELTQIIDDLEKEAASFEQAVDPKEKEKLESERAELQARKRFTENLPKIINYLTKLKTVHKCDQAIDSIDTTAITLKGKSIVSEALTPQLKDAIQSELDWLDANYLPLNLKPSGSRGETLHQLELRGAKSGRKDRLTDVLSEGEQRVVALAGFFAEVSLGQHSCPIVLDDPVSSLDHRYRAKIAARLVEESRIRQVIIFTHDIAFLLDLQEKAGELDGIYFTAQTVLQQNEDAGVPNQGLPWHAMPVNKRLKHLLSYQKNIEAFYYSDQAEYDKKAAYLYALLRETWEAAIEEIVFNGAVVRHGNEVQTRRLRQVNLTTDKYKEIDVNMSRCSTWMTGHDKSKRLDIHRPAPTEILDDINALGTFAKKYREDGQKLQKKRDAALKPQATESG